MKIRSDDIDAMERHLATAHEEGWGWVCYSKDDPIFNKDSIMILLDKEHATIYSLEREDQKNSAIAPLSAVLNAVTHLKQAGFTSLKGQGNRSIPFDIERIVENENFKKKFKTIVMNDKNVAYLEDQLVKTGFGEIQREDLIKNILEGKDSFQLTLQKRYGEDEATATLNFAKSDKGNYFFNNYELAVRNEGLTDEFKQRFKVNYGNTFSLKEAFNLMQGRSVFKKFINVDLKDKANNTTYEAWATMDFKDADKGGNFNIKKTYNFDFENELAQYPFKELGNTTYRKELIDSIQRGNRQSVTYIKGDKEEKMYVEANPGHKSLKLYDTQMNPLRLSMKIKAESQTAEIKEGQTQQNQKVQGQRKGKGKSEKETSEEEKETPSKQTIRKRGVRAA